MTEFFPRLRGWEMALANVVALHQAKAFEWGASDCLVQVADVDLAMTGRDPMAPMRGKYRSAGAATRLLRKLKYANAAAALAATYEEVEPAMARRGDCGVVDAGDGVLAAVIVLGDVVIGKSPTGIAGGTGATIISRNRLVRAFRIGW